MQSRPSRSNWLFGGRELEAVSGDGKTVAKNLFGELVDRDEIAVFVENDGAAFQMLQQFFEIATDHVGRRSGCGIAA